jgi:integrase
MKGHIRERGAGSFEIKIDTGKDAAGKRITEFRTVRGTKRQAQVELAKLIAGISKGEHVAPNKLTVTAHVEERIGQWRALNKITARTAERYSDLARNQIARFIGQVPLQSLKSADIERWHGTLLTEGRKDGRGLSPMSIRHAHRLLVKALKEAARHDLVTRNVANLISPPPVEDSEIVILTADQIRTVLTTLKSRPIYPKAILAIFAGLRRGEVLALRWGDVDFDRKTVAVKAAIEETKAGGIVFKTPKSKAGTREVPLPWIVAEALRDYRRQQQEQRLALGAGKLTGDVLLFARPDGGPQSPHTLSADWRKVAARIGIGVTFHGLRHTYASILIDADVNVVKVSKRLGHSSPTVTLDIYAHLFNGREDKSADAVDAAVANVLQP